MIIEEEMLQTASYTILLGGNNIGHCHLTGEIGILTHIFKTTAIERATGDSGTWTKENILLSICKLLTDLISIEGGKVAVPCCSEACE